MISRKVANARIYQDSKNTKWSAIIAIVLIVGVWSLYPMNKWFAFPVALVGITYYTYVVWKVTKTLREIESEYPDFIKVNKTAVNSFLPEQKDDVPQPKKSETL